MEHDAVQVVDAEEPVPPHRGVLRRHRLQRPAAEVAREDDVHHVLRGEAPHRRDRVDDRDRPLDRQLLVDADLLAELYALGMPVDERADRPEGVFVRARLPRAEARRFAPYLIAEPEELSARTSA